MSKFSLLFLLLASAALAVDFPAGKPVTLKVTYTGGTAPLKFAWTKDGQPLAATTDTYVIPVATPSDAGTYSVVVSNQYGSATAPGAVLTVSTASAPVFTIQPQTQAVIDGGNVTFSCAVSGTGPFTYQWQKNGVDILGATNSARTLGPVTAADSADYTVIVKNAGGSVTSSVAKLIVVTVPKDPVIKITSP